MSILERQGFDPPLGISWLPMSSDLPETSLEPLAILLVEDDPDLRASLCEVLQEEGYLVEAVPSGNDAIALSASRGFDLIVTDIKTPGATDGLSALEKVKEGNPEVAGIVITGYSTEEYALRAAKLRVENYLKKPFDIEDFLQTVDGLAEKKRLAQRALSKEVVTQRALRWLAARLVGRCLDRSADEVESYFRQVAAPGQYRDLREGLALETLAMLKVLALKGESWPEELNTVFPARLAQIDLALGERLASLAESFLTGAERDEELPPEEDGEGLSGSLLNVALLLESAERYQEAEAAFSDLLRQSGDPSQLYLAHFGLARLAREQRRFEVMESHAQQAVCEGARLGPLTHSQALAERAVLLAVSGSEQAPGALESAWEMARSIKDTGSFALMSLARERFLGQVAPARGRLLACLSQPEHFGLAIETGPWLPELLLSQSELDPEERRFLARLLRSCPASFERLLLQSDNARLLANALPFLEILGQERRQRALTHLAGIDDAALAQGLSQWTGARRRQQQEKTLLRVYSLSGIRLYRDDQALEMNRKKPLLLLLYLLYRNSPVGEESLLELFWPGEEGKARASLRTTLSYLRKLMCPEGSLDPLPRLANGISISQELPVWFDYREFETLMDRGKGLEPSNPNRAADCFRSAVRLYRGPFLENVYEDWALEVREQAELSFEHALRYLATASLSLQNWAQAYEFAARGLRRDPLSQPFCEMTMQALIGLQRPHDALAAFEQCRALLQQELDLEPSIEMIRCRELARLSL